MRQRPKKASRKTRKARAVRDLSTLKAAKVKGGTGTQMESRKFQT